MALSVVTACATGQSAGQSVTPQSMPYGFNYPTPGYVIEQWVTAGDIATMRAHSWDVWNAMSQPSGQYYSPNGTAMVQLPVWDTWQTDNQLFNTQVPAAVHQTLHPFHLAVQQTHLTPNIQAEGDVAISFNKFDPSAAGFILTEQPAPDGSGTAYPINSQTGLAAINGAWPASTDVAARAIRDFPPTAIETKPVFLPVLASSLTAVPLWQGPGESDNAVNPTPDTWYSCVLVDAGNTASSGLRPATAMEIQGATVARNFKCMSGKYLYAPIGMYYSVELDQAGAEGFGSLQGNEAGVSLSAGDYAVLVAMHVNTKELDSWTWETYYWQGDANHEVTFPGSLADAPANLAAPWSSYAMCTAYDQVIAGQQVVCFNPYLETSPGIPDGINSNCVSCHGMARAGGSVSPVYPPTYTNHNVFPIPVQFDDPRLFGGLTKTDFSWAVGDSP